MSDTSMLPALPAHVRPLSNEDSNWLESRFPDLPKTLHNCITCRGKKSFLWYSPLNQRDVLGVYECSCADQRILHRYMLNSGVTESYQRLGWADLTYLPSNVAMEVNRYLEHSEGFVSQGFGLIFYGTRGTGKTLMAHLLVKDLLSMGFDCYVTTFSQMLDNYASGWRDPKERFWFDRRVRNAGVLLIDELGGERNKGESSLGWSAMEEVIRHRVSRHKPTLITTNLGVQEMEVGYGGNTMSLLRERATLCHFEGMDRREEMKHRFVDQVTSGLIRPVVL